MADVEVYITVYMTELTTGHTRVTETDEDTRITETDEDTRITEGTS